MIPREVLTSQPPPLKPARYVADCSRPPSLDFDVLLSKASMTPAPDIRARQPPPEVAIPILGNAEEFEVCFSKYSSVENPMIFSLIRSSLMAGKVCPLLFFNHDVSFEDREAADRTEGLASGQAT